MLPGRSENSVKNRFYTKFNQIVEKVPKQFIKLEEIAKDWHVNKRKTDDLQES